MLHHINRTERLDTGVFRELAVLAFDRGGSRNEDHIPKKPATLELGSRAHRFLTGGQNPT